jgi:hypothetical protein
MMGYQQQPRQYATPNSQLSQLPNFLRPMSFTTRRVPRLSLLIVFLVIARTGSSQSSTFAGDAQHTAVFASPAQRLNAIRWTTPIDTHYTGFAHYGAPLITPSNTVIVPVKTVSGFQLKAIESPTGRLKYTLTNDYIMAPIASGGWIPVYQPVIASPPSGARLYYAGAGGTIYHIDNLDSDTPGIPIRECFYTNVIDYSNNAAAYNSRVFVNTPITADTNGNVFFGFRIPQTNAAPEPLNTTNGGFVRIDPAGNANYVFVNAAANDVRITRDSHNCAPALSNDGSTLYVAVKGTNSNYAYLLGLDSTNLSTKYKVFLRNPNDNQPSSVSDDGTASPMVGPDDDVFFGVLANNGSVGFMLHYSADLQTKKIPGGFGWDYTAAIVPTNMVPSYRGPSSYLLFSKYNNYAGAGNAINRIALLDPNVPQKDANPVNSGISDMREVLTAIGCTPDADYITQTNGRYPFAVREWCINTAAVNPATKSVFTPSEDGHLYRWDLSANSLAEVVALDPGVGEPYVPTVVGPDGTVYTLNAETLFAIGNPTNFSVAVYSSAPDLRYTVVGEPVTFTAIVTNFSGGDPAPTGSITFQDATYQGLTQITNILAANVALSNGVAAATNSSLIASTNSFGNHFITAIYSGDTNYPGGRATLVQKVHASGTTTTLTSAVLSTTNVTFSALATATFALTKKPTGMVTFWDGPQCLGQVGLNSNRLAIVTVTNFPVGNHNISATYASDTLFATSSANLSATPPTLLNPSMLPNGDFQFSFTNSPAGSFTILGSSDLTLPLSNWVVLGPATETSLGHYQFTDSAGATDVRFYSVRSP